MKRSLRVFLLAFLIAPLLSAQTQTVTVTKLAVGIYSVSSAAGVRSVNVTPLGNGSYSFSSSDGSSTLMTLAPGVYTITSSVGVNLGTTYIYSLGSGLYSFSNSTTGTTGSLQAIATPPPPPLVALAIQPPGNGMDMGTVLLLAAMARQQCYEQGGVFYKPHWYSAVRCEAPAEIESEKEAKERKKQGKPLYASEANESRIFTSGAYQVFDTHSSSAFGAVYVSSNPRGAEIYVDDSFVLKAPATLNLKPGPHYVRAFLTDYKNWSQQITIAAGSEAHLTITLEKSN